jgi:AmmeMemoRadiSam system protein B
MSGSNSIRFPKLRPVEIKPMSNDNRSFLLLRDPLKLSDKILLVPRALGPILALCDGTREDAAALAASLAVRFGVRADQAMIDELLTALDQAVLLDNDHFASEVERAREQYQSGAFRPAALAGMSYPADPDELREMLQGYIDAIRDGESTQDARDTGDGLPEGFDGRGIVSPHIDYLRGGPIYAKVWSKAAETARAADLAIVFGTDHYGGDATITLTRQNYATPFGVLPTAVDIVDRLAEAVGPEAAFEGELRHSGEHSIELASVWLHFIREGRPCEMVPILCGSFSRFTQADDNAEEYAPINEMLDVLKEAITGRRVLIVAAADLAHVGPAFGGEPVDFTGRAKLQEADEELIGHICAGDAEGFLSAIKRVEDRNNVCGVSPIYLALKALGNSQGTNLGYDRCPADEQGTSLVSICGTVLQ